MFNLKDLEEMPWNLEGSEETIAHNQNIIETASDFVSEWAQVVSDVIIIEMEDDDAN